jgi:sulfatase maturation enzyme AslB (radical SAM superfamily)
MSLSHLEVVLKPTFQCNAQCEYCNVPQVSGRMELRVLDALFRGIGSIMDKDPDCGVTILWHGGEPLVMGKAYSREPPLTSCRQTLRSRRTE